MKIKTVKVPVLYIVATVLGSLSDLVERNNELAAFTLSVSAVIMFLFLGIAILYNWIKKD